jgi:hypothetical protein
MSENESQTADPSPTDQDRTTALGVVATRTNGDQLARTLLRANELGYETFVTHYGDRDIEAVRFAEQLGATLVDPTDSDPDIETLRRDLAASARACASLRACSRASCW